MPRNNHDLLKTAQASRRATNEEFVSVVLPVFNEVAVLERLLAEVSDALRETLLEYEIVFVNDGSTDGSADLLDQLSLQNRRVRVIHFSRNFGHQPAVQAGLKAARGSAIVVMDSDLQDDPRAIITFIEKWRDGFDVVFAVRTNRKENPLKRSLFYAFYRLLERISEPHIPVDAGNFGLIDRRVCDELINMPEFSRFYPGLRHWVGFRQTGVPVERGARHDDQPRVSFWGLVRLAKTAIFSFSTVPLTLFYMVAALSCLVCVGLTGFTLYQKLWVGDASPGWASGLITASFFGMLNALGIAVLGEYVVRIFDQVRARPQFIIERTQNSESPTSQPSSQREAIESRTLLRQPEPELLKSIESVDSPFES